MKKLKLLLFAFTCIIICATLSGCAGVVTQITNKEIITQKTDDIIASPNTVRKETGNNRDDSTVKTMELTAKDLVSSRFKKSPYAETVAKGANDFAFRLSAALATQAGTENFICSPYSVWLPLAALINATDENSKENLVSVLGAAGISDADINNAASRMMYDLTRQGERVYEDTQDNTAFHNPLVIANAIFVDNDLTLNKDFAQTFLDYYRGEAMTVDFNSTEAVSAVNEWASKNTDGLIPNIIQYFSPDTIAALANAIYYSDRWNWEFSPEETIEDVFHSPNGDTSAFFMQREGDNQTYYEDDKVQAMPLTFKTGGGLYIIMPKDGDATGLLSSMKSEYYNEIQRNSILSTGKLLLPRFSIDSGNMDLVDTLASLGVPLFDPASAPLTGGLIKENMPVWISGVLQRAAIEVDEKGTTAAAVTILSAPGDAPPQPTKPFEMICNKPFIFILYSHTYDGGNQIIFTGIVNQPLRG